MKRGLVFSLAAMAVAAMAAPALAVVNVQLNLRYTNPANPTGGGSWQLLVQSNTAGTNGLAGIDVTIGGNLNVTGENVPANAIVANPALWGEPVDVLQYIGTAASTRISVGDGLVAPYTLGVGTAAFAGRVVDDDLFPGIGPVGPNNNWDNSTLLASGTWSGARPTLIPANVKVNEFSTAVNNPILLGAAGVVLVRGDSVGVDGLKLGDVDRNGLVNINDFGGLSANYEQPGVKGWDQGDFNSDGTVNINDFGALSSNYEGVPATSPPITAVPEPTSFVMFGIALLGLGRFVKRS